MKRSKNHNSIFSRIFVFLLLFTLVQAKPAYAAEVSFIRLNADFAGGEIITVWKVEDTAQSELTPLAEQVAGLTDVQLTEKYGNPMVHVVDAATEQVTVSTPGEGTYYVRVTGEKDGEPLFYPFAVTLPYEESLQLDVYPKHDSPETEPPGTEPPETEETEPPGTEETEPPETEVTEPPDTEDTEPPEYPPEGPPQDRTFLKVSTGTEKKPLEGAVFKISRTVNGVEQELYRDGKEYVQTSGKNGYFTFRDLPPGEYALWEITAPEGYVKLESPIRFTVNGAKPEVILIENRVKPPIDIPKTGDVQLLLLAAGGISLVTLGKKMTKEEKK